ncbi:pyridoxal phosphate-dependent aminotransferase [Pseudomonas brassicacearum]|uniref:pyridoxal phosphate-dependent aminotransferase n=1 Tax=Pseudomonas brassicacearum TaxID=930166 RepID=UPI003466F594
METYTIQEWLFKTAHGKYEIDLAESGVQFQKVSDIHIEQDWILDYSTDRGQLELRKKVAALYSGKNENNVIITHGGQEALYLYYQSTLKKGDHVITVIPGWQQSWEVPRHIGATVSTIVWEPGESFPVAQLNDAFTDKTKLLILNSPSNPLGTVIAHDQWLSIVENCQVRGVTLLNDEEYLTDFTGSVVSRFSNSVSVSGLSKVFGLPALRIGWAVADEAVIEAMVNYKRYTSVSNSLLCENIAIAALERADENIARYQGFLKTGYSHLKAFSDRHQDKLELVEPENTPFAWFKLKTEISSMAFAERLLSEQKMLVMPAEVFGFEKGIRVTYARDTAKLEDGFGRLSNLLNTI